MTYRPSGNPSQTSSYAWLGWEIDERNLKIMNLTYFRPEMRGNVTKKQEPNQHQICRQNIRHQKFIWEHHIWCHVKISEVATLVSMIPNFWCCLEVAATELHLCFIIKGNVWWVQHKHMKLFKPFTPHVIAWSIRKGFNQSIRRTKKQKRDCNV